MRQFYLLDQKDIEGIGRQIQKLQADSGSKTAEGLAAQVKKNRQIERAKAPALFDELESKLLNNSSFQVYASPKSLARLFINIYEVGDYYGVHSDAPVIGRKATDLSFTIFLNDPSNYDGGELSMKLPIGELDVKLKSGWGVVYSTGVLHEVKKITRGRRIALVGWVESFIKSEEDRNLLIELADIKEDLKKQGLDDQAIKLNKIRNDLIRKMAR